MTNESDGEGAPSSTPPLHATDAGSTAANAVQATMHDVEGFIARFSEVARAEACVGPAQTISGHTVVPIARVSVQAGFGMGFGGGGDSTQGQGSGGAAGGGGRGAARVIAVVDITEEGVKVQPVPDVTALSLAGMALAAVALLAVGDRSPRGILRLLGRGID